MNISTRKYFKSTESVLEKSELLDFSEYEFPGFEIKEPVKVDLSLRPSVSLLDLSLTIVAQVNTNCARCYAPVKEEYILKPNFKIREEDLLDDMAELPFLPNGDIVLEELVYQELLTSFPTIFLCSEDCEGLCQHCGKPKQECECIHEQEIDPRLQVLKQLLVDDEDESEI